MSATDLEGNVVRLFEKFSFLVQKVWNPAGWWLRYTFLRQYRHHIVYTDLERGGWYDGDQRILHACMTILCEHIEMDGGEERIAKHSADMRARPDPNAVEMCLSQAGRQDESLAIRHWWKVERPADQKRYHDLVMTVYRDKKGTPEMGAEIHALRNKLDTDEDNMLLRLMAIRGGLWT